MLVHPWDSATDAGQARDFVEAQGFGHLLACGRGRDVPVAVPTQYVLDGDVDGDLVVVLHLARPNPVWAAIEENPTVMLIVAGDWAFVPAAWKALGSEDPAMGIPTTYYAAVQLTGQAQIIDDQAAKADLLRLQQRVLDPDGGWADPAEHGRVLSGIRGLRITVSEMRAKFKYGGNVDRAHRLAIADRLRSRAGPGDAAALAHLLRRLDQPAPGA